MLNMAEKDVYFQSEVHENEFSATEIDELLSLFLVKDDPLSPGSDSSNRTSTTGSTHDDERKLRRMASNRESARRSRWRKKKQLEDLTNELTRLTSENRELKEGLGRVLNRCHVVVRENEWLWMESVGLGARLSDLHRVLAAMRSPIQNST